MLDGAMEMVGNGFPSPKGADLDNHGISSTVVQKPKQAQSGDAGITTIRPFGINIDWLTLNMDGKDSTGLWSATEPRPWVDAETGIAYWTDPTTIKTNQFAKVTYMMNEWRDKVATIYSEPHQKELHGSTWMQVQFANHTLYTGEWAGLAAMLRNEGVQYRSTSRIDIACDGLRGYGGDWCKVMQAEAAGQAKYYGKADSLTRRSRGKVIGGEYGSRRSNKFIRAYNKSAEMKAKGIKAHIVSKWVDALGFDPYEEGQTVERFELQCKGVEVRRHYPLEKQADWLDRIADQKQLLGIYASMVPGMFDYRTMDADRARDATPVVKWDWSQLEGDASATAERQGRNLRMSDHGLKSGIASIARLGIKQGDGNTLELARQYAEDAGPMYLEWYSRHLPQWELRERQIRAAQCPLDAMIRERHEKRIALTADGTATTLGH